MNNVVYVRSNYTFKSQSELEAEAAAVKQTNAPPAEAPPPVDLDALLTELDAELEKLDSLVTKEREFPGNITRIDDRLRELEGQDLSTLEALEARSALQAGTGHVLSTLLIAIVVWLAGVTFAERFGHIVDTVSSLALIAFGGWFAVSAWRDLRKHGGHGHSHRHVFSHLHENDQSAHASPFHGPELKRIATEEGVLAQSIFETGVTPRFRLSGVTADAVTVQTCREGAEHQDFRFVNRGTYWESVQQIPEPHEFAVSVIINNAGHARRYETQFTEHDHGHHEHGHNHGHGLDHETPPEDDPLYAPLRGQTAVITRHVHAHRHGRGPAHRHWHDHTPASSHSVTAEIETAPPAHDHRHKITARTALLLILGSSPMVEGIPAFFAAGKYGIGLIMVMAVVFAISTIATYVLLCVYSTAGLQRVRLGAFERYGEVLSGAFIALVGLAFWIWPVL